MQSKTYILIQASIGDRIPPDVVIVCDALKPVGILLFVYVILVGVGLGASLLRYCFK